MNKVSRAIFNYIKDMDKLLLFFCLTSSAYGIVVLLGIVNTFSNFTARPVTLRTVIVQVGATGLGLVAALIMAKIDYRFMAKMWKFHLPLCYLLVILTFFIGLGREGADDKAWLSLPGGLQLQPSEFLKLSFILTFALHLEKVKGNINSLCTVALLCANGAIPVLLIHFQGDDGSALVIFMIFIVMMFAAGLSYKYLLAAVGVIAAAFPLLWLFVMNYDQKLRILCLFDHDLDPLGVFYQQYQGLISLGVGQVWGVGLFSGAQRYVPEIHNDFVFVFIGNALGFVGCVSVIVLITLVCVRILMIARMSGDSLGMFICCGIFAMIAFQSIINIGMCLTVLPVIGITLPFFSAGGSSTATLYLGLGLAFSVYMHNRPLFFDS